MLYHTAYVILCGLLCTGTKEDERKQRKRESNRKVRERFREKEKAFACFWPYSLLVATIHCQLGECIGSVKEMPETRQ